MRALPYPLAAHHEGPEKSGPSALLGMEKRNRTAPGDSGGPDSGIRPERAKTLPCSAHAALLAPAADRRLSVVPGTDPGRVKASNHPRTDRPALPRYARTVRLDRADPGRVNGLCRVRDGLVVQGSYAPGIKPRSLTRAGSLLCVPSPADPGRVNRGPEWEDRPHTELHPRGLPAFASAPTPPATLTRAGSTEPHALRTDPGRVSRVGSHVRRQWRSCAVRNAGAAIVGARALIHRDPGRVTPSSSGRRRSLGGPAMT